MTGPNKTKAVLDLLRDYESQNITFIEPDGSWPIIWQRARGVHVWDIKGKRYLDLTAAFGVAAAGHANRRVVRAGRTQMGRLLHAMGDVHPHALKAQLARELSRLTFERWSQRAELGTAGTPSLPIHSDAGSHEKNGLHCGKTIFCNSGFEAVEAALKTARLATGRAGVIAFHGAYHGVGYGTLNATHRPHFRNSFRDQLGGFGYFLPFPKEAPFASGTRNQRQPKPRSWDENMERDLERLFRRKRIGAILVEPIQVRGGINVPPAGFLPLLRQFASEHGALLILDEIYTGFGRTGKWFACEREGVAPDLICLGKALTGGFPLSACVGRADLMDSAWPASSGEAIHTSTFLGHPVGCAMALAQIQELEQRRLIARSEKLGRFLLASLRELPCRGPELCCETRGVGLLAGLELRERNGKPASRVAIQLVKALLRRGYILLPEGEHANVLGFTPPLMISQRQLAAAVQACGEALASM